MKSEVSLICIGGTQKKTRMRGRERTERLKRKSRRYSEPS